MSVMFKVTVEIILTPVPQRGPTNLSDTSYPEIVPICTQSITTERQTSEVFVLVMYSCSKSSGITVGTSLENPSPVTQPLQTESVFFFFLAVRLSESQGED